jgi:predicted MPP superfamily phosphohydrolase
VRFTNSYNPGDGAVSAFTSGTSSSSSTFVFYKVITEEVAPPEEPETGKPLFTLAAISDLHTDYGIQNSAPYIRQGVLDTVARIRAEENANVLLVGGDITSSNSASWTKDSYDRAIGAVYEAASAATASGRVLYAVGNHDFSAGGANYNSGDYTDIM